MELEMEECIDSMNEMIIEWMNDHEGIIDI